jgi:hypothetical protein
MLIPATLALQALLSVAIEAAGTCPSAVAIRVQLQQILPNPDGPNPDAPKSDDSVDPNEPRVRIAIERDEIVVRWLGPTGQAIGERRLPTGRSCETSARAVAVVLSTWSPLPTSPPPPVISRGVQQSREPSDRPPSFQPERLRWEAELGGAGDFTSAGATWEAQAAAELLPGAQRFGGRLQLGLEGSRETSVPPGQARFSRWGVSAGPTFELLRAKIHLTVDLQGCLALLRVEGVGFASGSSESVRLDPGAQLDLRASWPSSGLFPFLVLSSQLWPVRHALQMAGDLPTGSLPQAEFLLGGGIAYGVR